MSEKIIFLKKYFRHASYIGSLTPSSKKLAMAVAKTIEKEECVDIVEVGAGTGSLTNEIMRYNPLIVEIDREFVDLLRKKFPSLKVINDCAISFLDGVHSEIGLIISIPLIRNPIKPALLAAIKNIYNKKLIKWCVIYTYGFSNPLKEVGFAQGKRAKFIAGNLPPASVWIYK